MRLIFIFIVMVLCFSRIDAAEKEVQLINTAINKFIAEMKEQGFKCYGAGLGRLKGINEVDLDFQAPNGHVSLDDARIIIVRMAHRLQCIIHAEKPLRPYLSDYPFFGIELMISFPNEDQNPDAIELVSCDLRDDYLCFFSTNKTNSYYEPRYESWKEAEEIATSSKSSKLKGSQVFNEIDLGEE